MDEFHPEIEAAANEIAAPDSEAKTGIIISTSIMVICSVLSLALACYRWRTEGVKNATAATGADDASARLKEDLNKLPMYDAATDTFCQKEIRQLSRMARREARKKHEPIDKQEAEAIAIKALRKGQQGASASCMASITPLEDPDNGPE